MLLCRCFFLLFFIPLFSYSQTIENCEAIRNKGPYLIRAVSISPTDDSLLYDARVLQHCFGADSIDQIILDRLTTASMAVDLFVLDDWNYTDLWEQFLIYKKSTEYLRRRTELETKKITSEPKQEVRKYQLAENGADFTELVTLELALEEAKRQQKPLFIYFAGHACVNCRRMEDWILSSEVVQDVLMTDYLNYVAYCDDKINGEKNARIQLNEFKQVSQPAFYILQPDGILIDSEGYVSTKEEFLRFLKQ